MRRLPRCHDSGVISSGGMSGSAAEAESEVESEAESESDSESETETESDPDRRLRPLTSVVDSRVRD